MPLHNNKTYLWLGALLTSALALRLFNLGEDVISYDEGYYITAAQIPLSEMGRFFTDSNASFTAYSAFLRPWLLIVPNTEFAIRLFSVLCSVLSVWILCLIGTKLYDQRTGLIAATLLAISAYHINFAQEAKMYALLTLFTALSFFYFIRFLQSSLWSHWALYCLTTTIAIYVHLFSAFFAATQGIFLLLYWLFGTQKERGRALYGMGAQALIALLSIGMLMTIIRIAEGGSGFSWIPKPDLVSNYKMMANFAGNMLALMLIISLCLISLIWALHRSNKEEAILPRWHYFSFHPNAFTYLLILWLTLPIGLAWIISLVHEPVLFHRYAIGASLPIYLLAALAITRLPIRKAIQFTLVGILALPSLYEIYAYHISKESELKQWRQAEAPWKVMAEDLNHQGQRKDLVICPDKCFTLYFYNQNPALEFTYASFVGFPQAAQGDYSRPLKKTLGTFQRVWLVARPSGKARRGIKKHLKKENFQEVSRQRYDNGWLLILLEKQPL